MAEIRLPEEIIAQVASLLQKLSPTITKRISRFYEERVAEEILELVYAALDEVEENPQLVEHRTTLRAFLPILFLIIVHNYAQAAYADPTTLRALLAEQLSIVLDSLALAEKIPRREEEESTDGANASDDSISM